MNHKTILTLTVASLFMFGCTNNSAKKENTIADKTVTKPLTQNVNSNLTTTVSCTYKGKAYSAASKSESKFINDSITNYKDSTYHKISIVVTGFEKPLVDTLNLENLEHFLMDSIPNFNEKKLGEIAIKGLSVNPESKIATLKYKIAYPEYSHNIAYDLAIEKNSMSHKKFRYISTSQIESVTVNSVSVKNITVKNN